MLRYESAVGSSSALTGGLLGMEYRLFPLKNTPAVGLGVGLELSFYNAKGIISSCSYSYSAKDSEDTDFEFRTTMQQYGERQNIVMLTIPLMLHYRGNPEKNALYAAIGAKFGLPVSGRYKIVEGTSFNSGYYAEENYEYTEQKFMGFGAFPEFGDQEIQLRPTYLLAMEVGINWRLQYILLYTGLYVEHALRTVTEKRNGFIATYNSDNPAARHMGSMLNVQYISGGKTDFITKDVFPAAIGLKIGVTLGHGRKKILYGDFDRAPVFKNRRR
jgi:hypothetical protein